MDKIMPKKYFPVIILLAVFYVLLASAAGENVVRQYSYVGGVK